MFYSIANDFEPEDCPIGSSSVAHTHSVSYEEVSEPSSGYDNLSEHSSDPPGPENEPEMDSSSQQSRQM